MAFTPEELRASQVRIRAKKFADHLRSERWAEGIPDADIEWLKDEEIETYKGVLRARGCVQRKDFKWEAP